MEYIARKRVEPAGDQDENKHRGAADASSGAIILEGCRRHKGDAPMGCRGCTTDRAPFVQDGYQILAMFQVSRIPSKIQAIYSKALGLVPASSPVKQKRLPHWLSHYNEAAGAGICRAATTVPSLYLLHGIE